MKSFKKRSTFLVLGVAAVIVTTSYARDKVVTCPNLTAQDIQEVIENGVISTEQGYTLSDEAGMSKSDVIINEPTANPFDTFYQMSSEKTIVNQTYFISVGNVLGKTAYEAKDRAKQILLSEEKVFTAKYDTEYNMCLYKQIDASPNLSNYPFKTNFETVMLVAIPQQDSPYMDVSKVLKKQMKKHRR